MSARRKKRGQPAFRSGFAVLYARYSPRPIDKDRNGEDRECHSDLTQLAMCRAYCTEKKLTIRAEFRDAAESGGNADRPGLKSAIGAMRPGDVLVAYSIDRIHRNLEDQLPFQRAILEKGCFIATVNNQQFSIDTRDGRLLASILGAFAEWNREGIGAVSSAHRRSRQENRQATSKEAPYGWRIVRPEGTKEYADCRIVPDLKEQATLRRLFELLELEVPRTKLRTTLHREGHRQRNGKPFWWKTLHAIEDRGPKMIATPEELESAALSDSANDQSRQRPADAEADRNAADLVERASEPADGLGAPSREVPTAQF